MKRAVFAVVAVFFLAVATAASGPKPRVAPPPLRVEAPTLQPSPAHVWIPGYWKWAGINYAWVEGRWVKGKPGRTWVPGSWEPRGTTWTWKPGKWQKIRSGTAKDAGKGQGDKRQ